jgi:hypothetical protein
MGDPFVRKSRIDRIDNHRRGEIHLGITYLIVPPRTTVQFVQPYYETSYKQYCSVFVRSSPHVQYVVSAVAFLGVFWGLVGPRGLLAEHVSRRPFHVPDPQLPRYTALEYSVCGLLHRRSTTLLIVFRHRIVIVHLSFFGSSRDGHRTKVDLPISHGSDWNPKLTLSLTLQCTVGDLLWFYGNMTSAAIR